MVVPQFISVCCPVHLKLDSILEILPDITLHARDMELMGEERHKKPT